MAEETAGNELAAIGRHLLAARREQGQTQPGLARRIGVSQATISLIETGRQIPSLAQALALAKALDLPLEWLIHGRARPGTDLRDLAVQLRALGLVDLWVEGARTPGAFLATEEVIALVMAETHPDPRVIESLPFVLVSNPWGAITLTGFAESSANPWRLLYRLGWLVDVAWAIDNQLGLSETGQHERFASFTELNWDGRPKEWDGLGRPMPESPTSPIWKRWGIRFDSSLDRFAERAKQLVALGHGRRSSRPPGLDDATLEAGSMRTPR